MLIFGTALIVRPTLTWVAWGIALHSGAYFAVAYFILARRRLPHVRIGLIGLVGGGLLAAVALMEQLLA